MEKITLTATINTRKNSGKVRMVTDVTIRLSSGKAIAFLTLGGKFNALQALNEFRKNPQRWENQPGVKKEDLTFYAKTA